ncbi:MAG: hypothetical protein MUF01_06060, partial [Bryobacterales bacterium]|nr:hypothetical protein [Bryobacterales bacterium]
PAPRVSAGLDGGLALPVALASVERKLALLRALHPLALTPEDEWEVDWSGGPPLQLRAVVRDAQRKQQWLDALAGQAELAATVYSYAEAVSLAGTEATLSMQDLAPSSGTMRGEGPLLLEELAERFGGGDTGRTQALALGERLLEQVIALRYQAGWLRRIRLAIPEQDREGLTQASHNSLLALEAEVRSDIAARHREIGRQVEAVLCPEGCALDPAATMAGQSASPRETTDGEPLAASLDAESTWLKILFVDRAFAAMSVPEGTQLDLSQATRAWAQAHHRATEAVHRMGDAAADRPEEFAAQR